MSATVRTSQCRRPLYGAGVGISFYAAPGPFTELTSDQSERVRRLSLDPPGLCLMAQGLLVSPPDAVGAGLSEQRLAERNTRPASTLLGRVLELDGTTPLNEPRPPERRVVGTCRHFAVMATAFLRAVDVPAPRTVRLRGVFRPTQESGPLDRRVLVQRATTLDPDRPRVPRPGDPRCGPDRGPAPRRVPHRW